ncbi:WXG100 family type VII secretion target [Mycolicibacterium lutetiense]
MSQIRHAFEAINASLDDMNTTTTTLSAKREEMDSELGVWASYWEGQAHEQANQFSRRVTSTLDNIIMATHNYIGKARTANEEMRAQEMANANLWG